MKIGRASAGPKRRRAAAPVPGNVFALDRVRIERALPARARYRYVQPRVEAAAGGGWQVVSPNCSRSIDPDGGDILIAWLQPVGEGRWRLHARDHAAGMWVPQAAGITLDDALGRLMADPVGGVLAVIYLDHNATTRPAPEVVAEMMDALQRAWANPSSTHAPGQAARSLLADARARVAGFLGCQGSEVVFTSGATEANHMAVLGSVGGPRRRIVLSAVEHPGLLALGVRLRERGVPVDLIPVDAQGAIDLDAARDLIRDDVALVSVMGANNETGVIMPIATLAELAHGQGARLHVDATQLAGKTALDVSACGADLMSFSAHKLAGPKGVGALYQRKGVPLVPLLAGRQERHRRGGTENLPGIAGFAAACEHTGQTLHADVERMRALRDQLEQGLLDTLPDVVVFGRGAARLPNTTYLRFGDLDAELVLNRLERAGIAASSGAACSAGGTQPSHVLLAMGQSPLHARGGVRFSLGAGTTAEDIDDTLAACRRSVRPLLEATV